MKIISTNVYVGPNVYANFKVIRHGVELGLLEDWPTRRLGDAFVGPLLQKLPGLHQHGCCYGTPGGFVRRLIENDGTWLGHVMEHVAIELQNVADAPVTFGRTRSIDGQRGQYNVVFEYLDEAVGLGASALALRLILSLLPAALRVDNAPDADWDFASELEGYVRDAQSHALGPSTAALVEAAGIRGIPWQRLNRFSLVQLGHGRYQKRIEATTTCNTTSIAVDLAGDKEQSNSLLRSYGLPVPEQIVVHSPVEAVAAARRIGFPVVVKPLCGRHGRNVSTSLKTPEEVTAAFDAACEPDRAVIVESHIEGVDHRLLVVNGQLVAAAKREPGHVVGNGKQTIAELVDRINRDPRRGIGHERVLTRLERDGHADRLLAKRGYDWDTVPPEGETVYLRMTANLSTGGTATDVTEFVHPDNRDMAIRAMQVIGLDIGGVDFLTRDIATSYRDTGGAICEINAGPGLRMHLAPSKGEPRDVAGPIIDMLFPKATRADIPIAAITGTNGKTTTSRMLAHILGMCDYTVGMASTDGVYIDGRLAVAGDMTGPQSAQMVLRDPSVDAAVLETARGGLLRSGLAYRRCNVAACLNVSADHLGLGGIKTLEQLATVKRVPIEVASDAAVLNADDPLCRNMAAHTDAARVCYVTMNASAIPVQQHMRAGGQIVALEGRVGNTITIYDGEARTPLLDTRQIPASIGGRAVHNVQNAMFAAALAYNLGISVDDIRRSLGTFDSTYSQAPGRLNIYDNNPFRVILDYAHNHAAVEAICGFVDRLEVAGRRIVVLAAPGNRRDEDIREIARVAAGHFDRYICRCDDDRRGRGYDEVAVMLKDFLLGAGVSAAAIDVIPDEQEATTRALEIAKPGDLVLALCDNIKRSRKQVIHFKGSAPPAAAIALKSAVKAR